MLPPEEPPINPFFYFNGFNSAIPEDYSDNPKIVAVAEYARSRGYHFVPVSICYRLAREHAREILAMAGKSDAVAVFCGSSMGGWFARIVQLMVAGERPEIKTAAIAFNPAYDLSMYGHLLLGKQRNHVTFEEYEWTMDHSAQLRELESSVAYRSELPFFVYLDKGDEVIGWERSSLRHAPISRLTVFEGGCHSFDHYHEALADFDRIFHG
jgi:predicted esterase YcpF (UPF0227 family)